MGLCRIHTGLAIAGNSSCEAWRPYPKATGRGTSVLRKSGKGSGGDREKDRGAQAAAWWPRYARCGGKHQWRRPRAEAHDECGGAKTDRCGTEKAMGALSQGTRACYGSKEDCGGPEGRGQAAAKDEC